MKHTALAILILFSACGTKVTISAEDKIQDDKARIVESMQYYKILIYADQSSVDAYRSMYNMFGNYKDKIKADSLVFMLRNDRYHYDSLELELKKY